MPSTPELIDDAAAEIFLHLPPHEPAHLIRASLVCKTWRRIITDRAFLRRYRTFHGAAPLLGYFHNLAAGSDTAPRFFPTAAPAPVPRPGFCGRTNWKVLDCRHGRVVLGLFSAITPSFVVWDPITGDHQLLPDLEMSSWCYTAAVLCAARGCAHLGCRGGPFRVVLAGWNYSAGSVDFVVRAHLYSSEAAAWVASAHLGRYFNIMRKPTAVVGDSVYFQLMSNNMILRYDMGKNCMFTFHPPTACGIVLLPMGDGSLGLAGGRGSRLCLWSTEVKPDGGISGWVRCKDIELMEQIPFMPYSEARVVGCAEALGVVFVETEVGLFTIDLESGRERKVSEPGDHFAVFPFTSFYTPDCTSGQQVTITQKDTTAN